MCHRCEVGRNQTTYFSPANELPCQAVHRLPNGRIH